MGENRKIEIEVKAVQISFGSMRKYQFDCPHCTRRIIVGPGGTEQGCNHGYRLKVLSFDNVIAVYKSAPTLEPAKA